MATSLPAVGTFSYNSVTFGVMTESSVEGKPVYDSAGRTVIYTIYTISAKTTINAGGVTSTDATLESMRRLLQQPGGALVYNGRGFGNNFSINTGSGNPRDVVWGPRPRLIKWESIGGNVSARVEWQVEIAIPDTCTNATYQFEKPMSYCFKVSWGIDNSGFTTRTYSGHILVAQTRATVGARTIQYNADQYRERVVPPLPDGFRRKQDFSLSEDRCRLDFTIVDEEIPVPLKPGVITCDANHRVHNMDAKNLYKWVGTISASYELNRTTSKGLALQYFEELVQDRVDKAYRFSNVLRSAGAQRRASVYFLNMSFTESDICGRNKANFSVSYFFLSDRRTLLRASGLFTPVPGTDYVAWKLSLANTAHHVRGNARMFFDNRSDGIVDLCSPETSLRGSSARIINDFGKPDKPFQNRCPPANESFLHYDLRVKTQVLDHGVELKALPEFPVEPKPKPPQVELQAQGQAGANRIVSNQNGYRTMYSGSGSGRILNEIQYRTNPTLRVILSGEAIRVCYPIAAPTLRSVAGAEVLPFNGEDDFFETAIIGNFGGVVLIGAAWHQTYLATEMPSGPLGIPPNPLLGA